MPSSPPVHPDIRRQLRARLLDLTPRAFELFAGDLLVYVGLQNVEVTRYVGDGGIDAHGDLTAESGLVCVPTGVQVKRHRNNVQRPDIDRFIGALAGQYRHGIFITTANYAEQARVKAISSPLMRVDTVGGDQVVALMLRHQLGTTERSGTSKLDERYFAAFETQGSISASVHEEPNTYQTDAAQSSATPATPDLDVISLRALSYALRVDTTTIRNWIEQGKLIADAHSGTGRNEGFFFRRDRIENIRRDLVRADRPANGAQWRQAFLDFARTRNLTKSYKPVLVKALLNLVDRNGVVKIDALVREFHSYYLRRQQDGKVAEFGVPLLANPASVSHEAIKRLIVRYPLDRFVIKGFLEYDPGSGEVRFTPELWNELRFYELLDVLSSADDQLAYYYNRHGQS
jgi:hypothetical protein